MTTTAQRLSRVEDAYENLAGKEDVVRLESGVHRIEEDAARLESGIHRIEEGQQHLQTRVSRIEDRQETFVTKEDVAGVESRLGARLSRMEDSRRPSPPKRMSRAWSPAWGLG